MARNQIYRGNPEQKLYTIFNDFSGGMNTTSVDELMMTNEYRSLVNVELKDQGKVHNRKGFGQFSVLKELLDENNITLHPSDIYNEYYPTYLIYNKYPLFKITKDTENVFYKLINADSLDDFKSMNNNIPYEMDLVLFTATKVSTVNIQTPIEGVEDYLFESTTEAAYTASQSKWQAVGIEDPRPVDIMNSFLSSYPSYIGNLYAAWDVSQGQGVLRYDDGVGFTYWAFVEGPRTLFKTRINHFKFRNQSNNHTVSKITKDILGTMIDGPSYNLKGINSLDHEGKLYFSINDLVLDKTGIGCYDYEEEEFSIIDGETGYVPSPFEVSNVGFNVLLNSPLNISMDTSGFSQIRGIYLTDVDDPNLVLSKIPDSGKFVLNIIFKGGDINPEDLTLDVYVEDLQGVKTDLEKEQTHIGSTSDGVIQYRMSILMEDHKNIFIKVRKVEQNTDFDSQFLDTADMLTHYKDTDMGPFTVQKSLKTSDVYVKNTAPSVYGYSIATSPSLSLSYNGTSYTSPSQPAIDLPLLYLNTITGEITGDNNLSYGTSLRPVRVISLPTGTQWLGYCLYIIGRPVHLPSANFHTQILNNNVDLNEYDLTLDTLIKINPSTFYRWKGTHVGDITDFDNVTGLEGDIDLLTYTLTYSVGALESAKRIETVSLEKVKLAKIKDRLVLYSGNTILFSELNMFNYFPNFNYVVLPLNSDDSIQKIAYFRGSWIIFTRDSIYRMSGTFLSDDFQVVLINDAIGCFAPESIAAINNTLIFLTSDGLYTIKQNFYMEGLENVEKVDKNIRGIIEPYRIHEALVYDEQYLLFMKDSSGYHSTLKQYYNMGRNSKTPPYSLDKYAILPENIFNISNNIISIKEPRSVSINGSSTMVLDDIYVYGKGYTDFKPNSLLLLPQENVEYMYKMSILTPNYSMGYQTHDKKFKTLYLKTETEKTVPVYVTLYLNNNVWLTPYQFQAEVNELGEIEYREILNRSSLETTEEAGDNLVLSDVVVDEQIINTIDPDLVLGSFTLGENKLGLDRYQVHKIVASGKGKIISVLIEQKLDEEFSLSAMGFLYKLGKVKESR